MKLILKAPVSSLLALSSVTTHHISHCLCHQLMALLSEYFSNDADNPPTSVYNPHSVNILEGLLHACFRVLFDTGAVGVASLFFDSDALCNSDTVYFPCANVHVNLELTRIPLLTRRFERCFHY